MIWAGGVADFGDPNAALYIQGLPGYGEYLEALQEEVRDQLGEVFPMYRAMTPEALEAWQSGADMGPVGMTFDLRLAKKWRHFAPIAAEGIPMIVVEVPVHPEAVIMRGKEEESELVVDANEISAHELRLIPS